MPNYRPLLAALVLVAASCSETTAPDPVATQLALVTAPSPSTPNRAAFSTQPVVELRDASGKPVATAGVAVTATITAGGGTLAGTATATTASDGRATFTNLSIQGKTGARTLTFTSTGLSTATAAVDLTAGAPAAIAASNGDAQTAIAGSAVSITPAVRVADADDNPVGGVEVTFAVATGNGSITGPAASTGTDGVASVGGWILGASAGANSLTASAAGLSGTSVTFTATGTAGPPAKLVMFTAPAASAQNRIAFAAQPVIQVQDANGNVISTTGVSVTAAIASGGGTLAGTTTVASAADGKAAFTNLSIQGTIGQRQISFSSPGLTSATATIDLVAGVAATVTIAAGDAQTATVGTAVATAPAAKVTDGDGNVVSGVTVTFAVASGNGSITAGSATTGANGIAAVGSWTLGVTAGANTLTATSAGLAGSPLTFTATGTAGTATKLVVATAPTSTPRSRIAFPVQPVIQLQDANGNPVATAGIQVTTTIGSGGGTLAGGAAVSTDASGRATFTDLSISGTIGARTLSFAAANLTGASANVTLTPGAPILSVAAGNNQVGLTGAAVPTAPAVTVADADGNLITGAVVTFSAVTGASTLTGAAATSNSSGVATLGSWKLGAATGTYTLSATTPDLVGTAPTFTATAEQMVVRTISAGAIHACGLTSSGAAYCWGSNNTGQLGDGTTAASRATPTAVAGGLTFKTISAGFNHTVALTPEGVAYAWGANSSYGALGDNKANFPFAYSPVRVAGDLRFKYIDASEAHTLALTLDGEAYAWGNNDFGKLGDGTTTHRFVPTKVATTLRFTQVRGGVGSSGGLTADGTAYMWGSNFWGSIGDGTNVDRPTPTAVSGGLKFKQLDVGLAGGVIAIALDGKGYAWGSNSEGELGIGTATNGPNTAPQLIPGLPPLKAVAAAGSSNFALTTEGVLWAWGNNFDGKIGDGTKTNRHSPTLVSGVPAFVAVEAGNFPIAIAADGTAWSWGINDWGQTGDGTTTNRTTPGMVIGGLKFPP